MLRSTLLSMSQSTKNIFCGFASSWKFVPAYVSILAQKWSRVPRISFITSLYEQEIMEVDVLSPTDSNYETIKLD